MWEKSTLGKSRKDMVRPVCMDGVVFWTGVL